MILKSPFGSFGIPENPSRRRARILIKKRQCRARVFKFPTFRSPEWSSKKSLRGSLEKCNSQGFYKSPLYINVSGEGFPSPSRKIRDRDPAGASSGPGMGLAGGGRKERLWARNDSVEHHFQNFLHFPLSSFSSPRIPEGPKGSALKSPRKAPETFI